MKKNNHIKNKTMFRKLIFASLMLTGFASISPAQEVQRTQPKFWIGVSGGANVNMYTGTTQTLNSSLMAPAAFHDGLGVGGFGSLLLEYRPIPVIGVMLNLGYDNRSGAFDQVISPCNCPEDLKTDLSYATIQPSIRISPFGPNFYVFLGGAYSYNISKSFAYTFDQNNGNLFNNYEGDFSNIRQDVFSAHVGIGYDIQLASADSRNQIALSPFVSYHPYFGQAPRNMESWSLSTVRVGFALKFGRGKVKEVEEKPVPVVTNKPIIVPLADSDVKFENRAPLSVPAKRTINEAFPLRDYVFFDEGSNEIPNRYVRLSKSQAAKFELEQLRTSDIKNQNGRSERQMTVYYNILNILGYRMQKNPTTLITLVGSSAGNGPEQGKQYAESVKIYLVDVFGVDASRIKTEGRNQPIHPSEMSGGKSYLVMLREGDRRVDIVSVSADLLTPLQIIAVKSDPMDSRVIFSAKSEKNQPLKSWNVVMTDEMGVQQTYGPYTREQESVSGNHILGTRAEGKYKVVMTGESPNGTIIRKESTMRLVHNEAPDEEALRFSILFDFDQSKAVSAYEKFLIEQVAPHINNNSKVIIHGHTDIIGDMDYNMRLSVHRAMDAQTILSKAVFNNGKTGVTFETLAFGLDEENAPFENKLPEERFYNRTVIIDIVQNK